MTASIDLSELEIGNPALTPALGTSMEEACIICLNDQNHTSGVKLEVEGSVSTTYKLLWHSQITEQMIRCWGDPEFTTEQAAYGIAFLLIPRITKYTAIERSVKGPGFDYWLGDGQEAGNLIFNNKARLEVSGIRDGSTSQIQRRINQKYKQTDPSDSTALPAFVVVVEFSRPFSHVGEK